VYRAAVFATFPMDQCAAKAGIFTIRSIRSSPVTVSRMRRAKHSLRNFLYVNGEEVEGIPFAFAVRIRVEEVFEGYQAPGADSF